MPLKKNLRKIVIIGSGPIVIGQACEFDYAGVQACRALMGLGLEVVLINSNPATLMTDPDTATKVYIEPLEFEHVKKILEKEKPCAIISTLGGQTALNLSIELEERGVLKDLNIQLLGATADMIRQVEDRSLFSKMLTRLNCKYAENVLVKNFKEGMRQVQKMGFPVILRPNYTLGGAGGGVAYSLEEFRGRLSMALSESPSSEVLVEKSLLGWKEFELEVMRDARGTFVIICSIENVDPCGVHTGDSITVAPQLTLSDRAYQEMRDEARKIIEEIGLETGGANIQFAVHPETGERLVIEVNPRVSRSSALASKATGFPIAKISALLAVGFHLDEITNSITKKTPSCYEPALDYVVTKIPRFDFEKYEGAEDLLSTQMQSVGEVMAIGRTFKESFQKACHSLEKREEDVSVIFSEDGLTYPNSRRIQFVLSALRKEYSIEDLHALTRIDPWFLEQFGQIVEMEKYLQGAKNKWDEGLIRRAKCYGFSDKQIARHIQTKEKDVYKFRKRKNIRPIYYKVDTCAGEFLSHTPYYYSTYWSAGNVEQKSLKPRLMIIGSGPNRIGQGIEFDYNCARGVQQFKKMGYEVGLINSNPETVSTDYDISDQLFFEPVSLEYVREALHFFKPSAFVIQLGGQTPIELAEDLTNEGFALAGSSLKTIDLAEDRGQFVKICSQFGFKTPLNGLASNLKMALRIAEQVGYPLICRPSYVLGGRRMALIENEEELVAYFHKYKEFSESRPCLMDQYLDSFLEVDVDLVRGPDWSLIGGVIEHIEAAGIHSGDSMGVLPPQRLKPEVCDKIEKLSLALADELQVLGFLNLQLAVREDEVYMLEANPRSSRSVPFISKATGIPLVDLGVSAMMQKSAEDISPEQYNWKTLPLVCVKGVVFPFKKFKKADSILGPEMKSIGEVMGRAEDYPSALTKALISSDFKLPKKGEVFLSLRDKDKPLLLSSVKALIKLGYTLSATGGTARWLKSERIKCESVRKVHEGRPHCVDRITSGKIVLVLNTTSGRRSITASFGIRRSCMDYSIPCLTESHVIQACVMALKERGKKKISVSHLREKR